MPCCQLATATAATAATAVTVITAVTAITKPTRERLCVQPLVEVGVEIAAVEMNGSQRADYLYRLVEGLGAAICSVVATAAVAAVFPNVTIIIGCYQPRRKHPHGRCRI